MSEHGLLVDAIFFLAAAVVCVPLAGRFRLGSVLGYLAAGCLIGPFGLRLVTNVESTLHFAELGVVLMLFVIGLELEFGRLWQMRVPVFGGGALQMLLCGAVLSALGLALGLPWQGALIAGLAIALSSTAIAAQTMNERGMLQTPTGRSALAVLLFQDMAAIPLIALVPVLGGSARAGFYGVLEVLAAIAVVVVAGRYLTRPVLRVVARTGREVFTGFALLLVLAVAQLMALVGVSMALGAFLAGVVLAGSEYRHALEVDLEPFKGLLLGLFFIAVGMSIDFGLLSDAPLLIGGLVLGLVGVKAAVLAVIAPALAVPRPQRPLFAALLAQGGEFAFVVFGVAGQERVLPEPWNGTLTVVVALSMALTPLLLVARDRWFSPRAQERAADVIEDESSPVIIAGFGRFGQIVGRLLLASGVRATLLDFNPDQVDSARKFGFRVFFGDASRVSLLEAAGAARAKLLVVALDDMAASLRLVEVVREHFPDLQIIARARNVSHYLELRARGVQHIEREMFEASLLAGRRALEVLHVAPAEARELADRFRAHNVETLEALLPLLADEAQRLSVAKAAREQLESQFAADRAARERTGALAQADGSEYGVGEKTSVSAESSG